MRDVIANVPWWWKYRAHYWGNFVHRLRHGYVASDFADCEICLGKTTYRIGATAAYPYKFRGMPVCRRCHAATASTVSFIRSFIR